MSTPNVWLFEEDFMSVDASGRVETFKSWSCLLCAKIEFVRTVDKNTVIITALW